MTLRHAVALAALAATSRLAAQSPVNVLADRYWQWSLRENPVAATYAGVPGYDDRLGSVAPDALARQADSLRAFLAELARMDQATLAGQERVTAEILALRWRDDLDELERRTIRIPVNAEGGFHTGIAGLPRITPARTPEDIERYARRLEEVPRYFREHVAWMRRGLAEGYVPPRIILEGMESTMQLVTPDPEASVFWEPVTRLPASVSEPDRRRVRQRLARVIADSVARAYGDLFRFFTEEYRPRTRATLAARLLPDGEAFYRQQVRHFTTLPLEPDSVHAIGLAEVARIRAEMDRVRATAGFRGTHAQFLRFLRTDPRFAPKSAEELLGRARDIAKRVDWALPSQFGRLPRQPYGVVPVPAHLAPKYTAGRYSGAPIGGTRAGEYWVNTTSLRSRTLYTLEALTLHEAVPGHHLQTALAQELEGIPEFRRRGYFSAFGEGWGLYSERLGLDMGFYRDPYSDFGRLTYEMWRACRLVVDTGLHWKGWSRQQAIDYMAANTALAIHEVTTEVDRYIGWPGQALAYKIGELEIRALRAEAERRLGPRFDVRAFHDVVLGSGSVPLPTLRRLVGDWIVARGG
ncbi:MAG: DUF885 domain-containing protein [Gemmatimonadota bacterium]|jgi:uncharacterized protein (DUF885 family)|nr:DUF885 domain-containing protein [Gemmatimonadota bacterium]